MYIFFWGYYYGKNTKSFLFLIMLFLFRSWQYKKNHILIFLFLKIEK